MSGQFALTAVGGPPVEDISIGYAKPGELPFPEAACLIWPDGRGREGDQVGPRRAVGGGRFDGPLPDEQKQSLLVALGNLAWRGGGLAATTPSIHLDSGPDSRVPPPRELCEMLVAKRFIDEMCVRGGEQSRFSAIPPDAAGVVRIGGAFAAVWRTKCRTTPGVYDRDE